ncbi:hypothetical protein HYPBUDRAFT_148702 [Hyphopichia burtonii NRRL Y-1933]|uniref:Uncharacterized protein n=1 Tax=Hyphopichia burtonii NRRL Y-1933 TaxID=984485 RepID=A0A1E4RIK3_9ASCO|nr:hypothetical protein HYPBUDRAFT_148702 [Hyphopichia burtonii NRRL Y-1933]ODV66925.1 hypothetical protein HYPBUDRAFT_148702 [Hyphopichia burtonii NRRL Y-1933]
MFTMLSKLFNPFNPFKLKRRESDQAPEGIKRRHSFPLHNSRSAPAHRGSTSTPPGHLKTSQRSLSPEVMTRSRLMKSNISSLKALSRIPNSAKRFSTDSSSSPLLTPTAPEDYYPNYVARPADASRGLLMDGTIDVSVRLSRNNTTNSIDNYYDGKKIVRFL